MEFKKIISLSLLAVSMSSVYMLANAETVVGSPQFLQNLSLDNNTDEYVTSKVGAICSSSIPDGSGVTNPREPNHVVNGKMLGLVCGIFSKTCTAEVHVDNHCGADSAIGTVTINMKTGFQSAQMTNPHYQVVGSGFKMILNYA